MIETADQTLGQLMAFDTEINDYAGMAQDEYGDSVVPYREAATAALESLSEDDDPTP